jgi:hypothetical protein
MSRLTRLGIWIVVSIFFLGTCDFLLRNLCTVGWSPSKGLLSFGDLVVGLGVAAGEVFGVFFGFNSSVGSLPLPVMAVLWVARLLGFVSLGLLIGVASTKLSRLSSE